MESIIGKRVMEVRQLTDKELSSEGWLDEMPPLREVTAIVLEDDITIYASRDDEGNGPGALFGNDGDTFFRIYHPPSAAHKKIQAAWEKEHAQ